jgi:hypothetical protein
VNSSEETRAKSIKVLFVAGYERSGTTLLHNVLAQVPGFLGVGEISRIWDWGMCKNPPCSCGSPFQECELWREVIAMAGLSRQQAKRMLALTDAIANWRLFARVLPGGAARHNRRSEAFQSEIASVYRALAQCSGCDVIVDSSKAPLYLEMLQGIDDLRVYTAHVVRHPCGVEYSKLKRRQKGHPYYKRHHSTVRASLGWLTANAFLDHSRAHCPKDYLQVRYEDFVDDPRMVTSRILDLVEEPGKDIAFFKEQRVLLQPTHSFAGSEHRHAHQGELTLRPDISWRGRLPRKSALCVNAITFFLRKRYGY